ncbi:hypothetical protein [Williamsia muralis]
MYGPAIGIGLAAGTAVAIGIVWYYTHHDTAPPPPPTTVAPDGGV